MPYVMKICCVLDFILEPVSKADYLSRTIPGPTISRIRRRTARSVWILVPSSFFAPYTISSILELSSDVIREIARKYENVQKGIGAMMRGPLIQTEARTILNESKKETALRMLKMGKLTVEEIAEYSALSVAEVEQLANLQTV